MKKIPLILLMLQSVYLVAQIRLSDLPTWQPPKDNTVIADWLISPSNHKADVSKSSDGKNIIISNGLLKRVFRVSPNLACIDYTNLSNSTQLLRAVGPEAKVTLNGKQYNVGGLYGQPEKAYLENEWIDSLRNNKADFQFQSFQIKAIEPYVKWKVPSNKWVGNRNQATGKVLSLVFKSSEASLKDFVITVNYEIYDDIPLICKSLTIENRSANTVVIDKVVNEVLAVHEDESSVATGGKDFKVPHSIYIESNYAFNNSMNPRFSDQTTHWNVDTTYTSQVNGELKTPCLLEVHPPIGPGIELQPNKMFRSIRTNELLLDSYDRERNGLAQRMMYRKLAPWSTENPIFMHVITIDPKVVKDAVDQCVQTGYEGIILSFFSGINMEDISINNIEKIKSLVDYAHSKGILLGGYSLFSSRTISKEDDIIDPKTGKPNVHATFGHAPCLGSKWGLAYLKTLKEFIKRTGLDIFEHDGPYVGDVCASTSHPGHKGLKDSQWAQMELQKGLYRWCSENGIYVNAPDWYFLDGTNKIALGYREANFKLSRAQQVILNRQNIYDGTWEKTPSMSWGFVPLTEYGGGDANSTLEPLSEHLDSYEQLMVQYYGAGIQACYRGPRLYDSEATKQMVTGVIDWYKKHRLILNSDIIHLRRPDGRDWDGILHVNPAIQEKGMAMFYNPASAAVTRTIKLPLYYTGIKQSAKITEKDTAAKNYSLDGNQTLDYRITIPAKSYSWILVEDGM